MKNSINKVLPIDLYHMVSVSELILERALKIFHVTEGMGEKLPDFEPGTFIAICKRGSFSCKVSNDDYSITEGQVMLAASENVVMTKSFGETSFSGVIISVSEEFFINRQRFLIRDVSPEEMEDAMTIIGLIGRQMSMSRNVRGKVVESLLRALIICLQYSELEDKVTLGNGIPSFFVDLASLISRYHHSPAYFYAEKLGLSSPEFNTICRQHSQMTAVEWIADYVLLEAKDLLRKTRLRPSQIAIMLGFSNQDTFSRWFRRLTGEFPSEWK